jgi:hypothetical protein
MIQSDSYFDYDKRKFMTDIFNTLSKGNPELSEIYKKCNQIQEN